MTPYASLLRPADAPTKSPAGAYWPTRNLRENLEVFRALVWKHYLHPSSIALSDQIVGNSRASGWDPYETSKLVWEYCSSMRYIAPPAGEELYVDLNAFLRRGGGDCDNKTFVFCCLALAKGVQCRAVVIEIPTRDGRRSGNGHMFPEALIPGQGWVAFDPAIRDALPGMPGHAVKGWRVAVVPFTGSRPTESDMARTLNTRGYLNYPALHAPQAAVITGMLTGVYQYAFCSPGGGMPVAPVPPGAGASAQQQAAYQDAQNLYVYNRTECQREKEEAGSFAYRAQTLGEEGLGSMIRGFFSRASGGAVGPPTGGGGDWLPVIGIVGGAVLIIAWVLKRRAA